MPDVDDIAAVNVRSWRARFGDVLPAPVLEGMDASDLAMVWASAILNPPTPGHRVLVATDGDAIVGYAAIGPSSDPDAEPDTVELLALEVDPDRTRHGHGSRLMAAAMDVAKEGGAQDAAVWCALDDQVRRAFLQSAGWGPDTAFRDVVVGPAETDLVREVRLVTDLTETQ